MGFDVWGHKCCGWGRKLIFPEEWLEKTQDWKIDWKGDNRVALQVSIAFGSISVESFFTRGRLRSSSLRFPSIECIITTNRGYIPQVIILIVIYFTFASGCRSFGSRIRRDSHICSINGFVFLFTQYKESIVGS